MAKSKVNLRRRFIRPPSEILMASQVQRAGELRVRVRVDFWVSGRAAPDSWPHRGRYVTLRGLGGIWSVEDQDSLLRLIHRMEAEADRAARRRPTWKHDVVPRAPLPEGSLEAQQVARQKEWYDREHRSEGSQVRGERGKKEERK